MSTVTIPNSMTVEEFLALPEDPSVERMLVDGELWEKPVTRRNRRHSRTETRVSHLLESWAEENEQPLEVFSGEAGVRFPERSTLVGIGVVVVSTEVLSTRPDETTLIHGVPLLAVEILSPSDKQEEIQVKVAAYLEAGVKLVWVVDPVFRTVSVYRPDADPEMFAGDEPLTAEPHLPGFSVPTFKCFQR